MAGTLAGAPVAPATAVAPVGLEDRLDRIADWVRTRRRGTAVTLTATMLALVAIVTHLEIDRLIAGFLTPETGRSSPLGGVIGPLALAQREDAWEIWSGVDDPAAVGRLILVSLAVDVVFVVSYAWLICTAIRKTTERRLHRWVLLTILLGLEFVEAVFLGVWAGVLIGGGADPAVPVPLTYASAAASTGKWLLTAAIVLSLLLDPPFRRFLAWVLRRGARAVWLHRLSAVLVVLLFALSCIPSDGVLDQLPDLQRQWTDDAANRGQILTSAVIVAGAWFAAFAFGRMRTRAPIKLLREAGAGSRVYAYPRMDDRTRVSPYVSPYAEPYTTLDSRPRMHLRPVDWWWAASAAGFVLVAALEWGLSGHLRLHAISSAIFLAIPALVVVASLIPARAPNRWEAAQPVESRAKYGWMTGDVIAVLIPCVVGLGLVRSLAGPLAGEFLLGLNAEHSSIGFALFLFVGGVGLAVAMPLILLRTHRLRSGSVLDPTHDVAASDRLIRHYLTLGAVMLGALLLLVAIMVWPVWAAELVGAQGVTVAALTLWGALFGAFTVALQEFPPLPVFVRLRMRATPVLTLGVTVPLIAGVIVASSGLDDAALHAPRAMAGDARSTFEPDAAEDLIDVRLAQIATAECGIEFLPDGAAEPTRVRPVLVIAAEGGGIRAAYWTAKAFEALQTEGGCLGGAVLLSSGVSGGSVGMAITAALEQGGGLYDVDSMLGSLATPETVAVGAAGLMMRDQVAGISGISVSARVPAVRGETTIEPQGWDRAALIERSWIHDIPKLAEAPAWADSNAIGIPVFNSTDARTKCKVLITPLRVAPARNAAPDAAATDATPDATATPDVAELQRWDCVDAGEAPAVLPVGPECFTDLDWAGVAMLSARFPTITPAGRIRASDACGQEDLQLIDGGYAEGSALGTVAELAPLLVQRISAFNERAGEGTAPLVPVLLYVKNSAGYDLRSDVDKVAAEPLVPLVGFAASAKQQLDAVLLQRVSAAFERTSGADVPSDAVSELSAGGLPGLAITVAPRTVPTITPPLGWSLSAFSSGSLDQALEDQLRKDGHNGAPTLRTLFDLVE